MREADKSTLGQHLSVKFPHSVVTLSDNRGHHWLPHAQMTPQYQGLLCESSPVKLEVVQTLNPATFLPDEAGSSDHSCLEILDEVFSSRPDLTDKPLQNPDVLLCTDGSSFTETWKRMARYAMVSDSEVVEVEALPQGWSEQRVELWALIRALKLSQDRQVNIYTDSQYAFATLHFHRNL